MRTNDILVGMLFLLKSSAAHTNSSVPLKNPTSVLGNRGTLPPCPAQQRNLPRYESDNTEDDAPIRRSDRGMGFFEIHKSLIFNLGSFIAEFISAILIARALGSIAMATDKVATSLGSIAMAHDKVATSLGSIAVAHDKVANSIESVASAHKKNHLFRWF